jgi:hypothetical protein
MWWVKGKGIAGAEGSKEIEVDSVKRKVAS